LTKFWHSCTMFVPDTPVLTQVLVMTPWVQPVVRPTLLATSPTISPPSATIENAPVISSDPLFGPLVWAMPPSVNGTPAAYAARHTHEHAIGGLVEIDEDHAALRECFVRDLLEPLVQITIGKAPREDTDAGGAARASKAAEEPFGQALLPQIGEIDGGHAVID